MPLTPYGETAIDRLLLQEQHMETVDCYCPIFDGLPFPIAQVCLSIRPQEDCAFRFGIAADVMYEDPFTEKWHAMPGDRARRILEDIRRNDPDKWDQIERAARLNFGVGDDEPDPAHYAEDELEEFACPR